MLSPLLMPERDKARAFYAMLHNTASPTIARAGSKLNLLPELAECELDARILPGSSLEELSGEVSAALGDEAIAVEVLSSSPPVSLTGYRDACFEQLSAAIKRHAAPGSSGAVFWSLASPTPRRSAGSARAATGSRRSSSRRTTG